jgi:hypothetical protein
VHQVAVGVATVAATVSSLEPTLVARKTRLPAKSVAKLDTLPWIVVVGLMNHTHSTTTIPRALQQLPIVMKLIQTSTPTLLQQITLQGNWTS